MARASLFLGRKSIPRFADPAKSGHPAVGKPGASAVLTALLSDGNISGLSQGRHQLFNLPLRMIRFVTLDNNNGVAK